MRVAAWACVLIGCTYEIQIAPAVIRAPNASAAVTVGKVVDGRKQRHLIGVTKGHGWGGMYATGDVLAGAPVTDLVRESLEQSLSASGMSPRDGVATWLADVTVESFFAEPDLSSGVFSQDLHAQVDLTVSITAPDGAIYRRTFVGRGLKEDIVMMSQSDFGVVLHLALEDAVYQVIVRVGELIAGGRS